MAASLDPDCAHVLQRMSGDLTGFPSAPTIEDRRAMIRSMAAAYGPPPAPVARVEDRAIDTAAGKLLLRVYTPLTPARPMPLLLHIHGGGWAIGDPIAYERVCRAYCEAGGCVVVDVHYRRAPEHKYPAALDDCEAALAWASANAAALGADPALIGVTGDSAGGNLAAALCQRSPLPAFQILVYPVLSASAHAAFPSRAELGDGRFFLRHADIKNAELEYLRGPADGEELGASPLLAPDDVIRRLPATLIVAAELDPLLDEGQAYARRLKSCGVPTRYECIPGVIHAFVLFAGAVRAGAKAISEIGETIRRAAPRPLDASHHR